MRALLGVLLLFTAGCREEYVAYKPTGKTRYVTEHLDHFWQEQKNFRYHIDCEDSGRLASDVDAYILGHPAPAFAVEKATGLTRIIDVATCRELAQFIEPGIDISRVEWNEKRGRFSFTCTRGVMVVETRPSVEVKLVAPAPAKTYKLDGPDAEAKQGWDTSGESLAYEAAGKSMRWSEDGGIEAQHGR